MLSLVLLVALLGLTSARPEGFFLPSGIPYLQGRENVIPYSTAFQIHAPVVVPFTVPTRVAIAEPQKVKSLADDSHTEQKDLGNAAEENSAQQVVSNEQRILTPSNTVLTSHVQPFAPRQLVLLNAFPTLYGLPKENAHSGENALKRRVVRQVLGSPVWDRKVIDWGSKNCPPLPLIGGAVAGASGGPVGVALGVIGAGIGACNFN